MSANFYLPVASQLPGKFDEKSRNWLSKLGEIITSSWDEPAGADNGNLPVLQDPTIATTCLDEAEPGIPMCGFNSYRFNLVINIAY